MRVERSARRREQHVVVVGGDECANGDEAVSARAILDDDRLAPTAGQTICEQSRADIDAAARSKGHDELDRPLRPCLCRRWVCGEEKRGEKTKADCERATLHAKHWDLRCHTD